MSITPTLVMSKFPDFNEPGFDIEHYNKRFHQSNVVIRASASSVDYPLHWGPLSVKCSFRGEEHYETGNSHYAADDEHFLVFNHGKMYSSWIDSDTPVESLTLNIAPRFEQTAVRCIKASANQQLDDPYDDGTNDFRFTERLYRHGSLVTPVVHKITRASLDELDLLFYELMEQLLSLQEETRMDVERIDKIKRSTRLEIYERLQRARDFIHSSYRNELSVDDMAQIACMNSFYFLRQFRTAFKTTPHQFLTERRMQIANRLLRTTGLSVTEICEQVGFNDLSSFGKLFRRRYGVSPTDFRMYVKS